MGIFTFPFWVLVAGAVVVLFAKASGEAPEACKIAGCKCWDYAKTWKVVNCTFNNTQRVEFAAGFVPNTTMEVSIAGGEEVIFQPQAFVYLGGFTLVRVDSTKKVFIRRGAFTDLTSPSLLLQVQGCDRFVAETTAFKNMQTPISLEVNRCSYVSIQNSAFSRLQDGKFHNIHFLDLAEGAFLFLNQGILSRHGPVTTLSFLNVIVPKIPREAFYSSLAEISIKNSEVHEVHSEAFKASEISAILLINSSIHRINSGAFSERTQIIELKISKCKIRLFESRAVMAGLTNLTVEHSIITEIQSGAINSTVVSVSIADNDIGTFHEKGFVLHSWNRIHVNDNIIVRVHSAFLEMPYNPDVQQIDFTFVGNEIYKIQPGALSFIPGLRVTVQNLKFSNNFFNQTCRCDIDKWVAELFSDADEDVSFVLNTSFCTVNALLSRCFQLQIGLINMHNFTNLVCGLEDFIKCEPYSGETKVIDTTTNLLAEDDQDSHSGLILGLVLGALLVMAVSGTIVILLIRGGLWLKRKGYCMRFRNMHYHPDRPTIEEENTIVPIERGDKIDVPDELTPEILQRLREQLEDPATHEDAREMIERLYELFITGDSYTNNNRQEEEAHLYEELGNLQPNTNAQSEKRPDNPEPFGFLKMMEEKYNTSANPAVRKPTLAEGYSEPTDAAVHLYSELQQNKVEEAGRRDSMISFTSTQRSNGSGKMAFRPLPEKPPESEPGPSKLKL